MYIIAPERKPPEALRAGLNGNAGQIRRIMARGLTWHDAVLLRHGDR
jgi:hypothetical protein